MVLECGKCYKFKNKLYELINAAEGIGYLKDPSATDNRQYHATAKLTELEPIDEDKLSFYLKNKHRRPVIMDEEDERAWNEILDRMRGDKNVVNEF